jgi:hypothetical protein
MSSERVTRRVCRGAQESQTSKGRDDPFGLQNQHDVISGVLLSQLSPSDRLLVRALGWSQP